MSKRARDSTRIESGNYSLILQMSTTTTMAAGLGGAEYQSKLKLLPWPTGYEEEKGANLVSFPVRLSLAEDGRKWNRWVVHRGSEDL